MAENRKEMQGHSLALEPKGHSDAAGQHPAAGRGPASHLTSLCLGFPVCACQGLER